MTKQKIYASAPDYDQLTQYVVEAEPLDKGDHIHIGCVVKDVEKMDLKERQEDMPTGEYVPPMEIVPKPTLEQRIAALERAVEELGKKNGKAE